MAAVHSKHSANGSQRHTSPQADSDIWPGLWLGGAQQWALQASAYQMAWQRQWWGFVAERLKKDAALFEQLATCGEPADATRICSKFMSETLHDYQEETAALAKLGSGLASSALPGLPNDPAQKTPVRPAGLA